MQPITMKFYKSTKNTHVYKAAAGQVKPAVESVYVEKSAFGPVPPQEIMLTLMVSGEGEK